MSQSIPTGYIPLVGNPRRLAPKNCPGGRDLTFESCPGAGNSTRAGILWKFKVKRFVRLLVLLGIHTGCRQKLLKNGEHYIVDFQFNYAKRRINVCSGGDLCSLFFSNFSETPCVKISFDVRISFV